MIAIVAIGVVAVAAAWARAAGDRRYQSGVELVLGAVAVGLLLGAPAILAAMAVRRRAVLVLPAACLVTVGVMVPFYGLVFLLPCILLWVVFATRWDGLPCGPTRGGLAIASVPLLVTAGAVALFIHPDARSFETATGGGMTSDVVTPAEAMLSIGLVSTALFGAWLLTAPVRGRRGG